MSAEQVFAGSSVAVSLIALGLSTVLLTRQNKQIEHERNALAILDAIARLTDPAIVARSRSSKIIGARYPDDEPRAPRFRRLARRSRAVLVAQYVETVACLARRRVLDASLLVDAVGFMLRIALEYDSSVRGTPAPRSRQRVSLRELRVARDVQHVVEGHAAAAQRPELRSEAVRRRYV